MDNEPIDMLNPIHLNRAARGMHGRLLACLPESIQVKLVDNTMQFVYNGATIQVLADAFWKHPTVVCWFVSVSHSTFVGASWPGTPNADRALLDVGMAMQFANIPMKE
jgi:hypothetical protein